LLSHRQYSFTFVSYIKTYRLTNAKAEFYLLLNVDATVDFSPKRKVIREIKLRRSGWMGHVAHRTVMKNMCKMSAGKSKWKSSCCRSGR
jgi:hypothetical protein